VLFAYYSDHVALPLPDKHAFPRNKYRLARELVGRLPAELGIELRLQRKEARRVAKALERIFASSRGRPPLRQRALIEPASPRPVPPSSLGGAVPMIAPERTS